MRDACPPVVRVAVRRCYGVGWEEGLGLLSVVAIAEENEVRRVVLPHLGPGNQVVVLIER
jgi:hypothetical protein